jgi:hypothetical protein
MKKIYNFVAIFISTITFALLTCTTQVHTKQKSITDKLGITTVPVSNIFTPTSIKSLQSIVKNSNAPLSIKGAGYSQGGQTGYPDGIVKV